MATKKKKKPETWASVVAELAAQLLSEGLTPNNPAVSLPLARRFFTQFTG